MFRSSLYNIIGGIKSGKVNSVVFTNARRVSIMGKDHLEVTKDCDRNRGIHPATVVSILDVSPTVKEVVLAVDKCVKNEEFKFLPGQWVDTFLPGVDKVGGFSITSTPRKMREEKLISLAVKYSKWAPALWIHSQCSEGSVIKIRSGGDFFIPESPPSNDLLFIAGGVGINPIASMIFHLHETNFQRRMTLLYSAKSKEELIFKKHLDAVSSDNKNFRPYYFTTRIYNAEADTGIQQRRITQTDLTENYNTDTTVYICGPPPLIKLVVDTNLPNAELKYEKWWA